MHQSPHAAVAIICTFPSPFPPNQVEAFYNFARRALRVSSAWQHCSCRTQTAPTAAPSWLPSSIGHASRLAGSLCSCCTAASSWRAQLQPHIKIAVAVCASCSLPVHAAASLLSFHMDRCRFPRLQRVEDSYGSSWRTAHGVLWMLPAAVYLAALPPQASSLAPKCFPSFSRAMALHSTPLVTHSCALAARSRTAAITLLSVPLRFALQHKRYSLT